MILTRPDAANSAFMGDFPKPLAAQLTFIESPLLRVVPLQTQAVMAQDAAAVFTSVNGVRFAPQSMGRKAYCVGVRTTQAATAAGWEAICAGRNAEELVASLLKMRPDHALLHLSGAHTRGQVSERLTQAGLKARRMPLYDQVLLPLSVKAERALESQSPVIVPLFSPRTAAHFAAVAPDNPLLRVVGMSAAVTAEIGNMARFEVLTADEPTSDSVIDCIEKQVAAISLG
ncbi:MAG: uroporphyrinogen-III synthase [Roseobacter sp.]|nr:uroporphyrinogen-III synthase [Roseobacter sp.]